MTRPTRLLAALTLMVPLLAGCGDSSTRNTEVNPEAGSGDVGISAPEVDLHTAVISGDTDAVRQHIQAGSDLNVADPFGGSSPLITAATFGRTAIARLLIEAGADAAATMQVYGGRWTVRGLLETSAHPATAGVVDDFVHVLGVAGA